MHRPNLTSRPGGHAGGVSSHAHRHIGPGPKVRRAGNAFVHSTGQPSAAAYRLPGGASTYSRPVLGAKVTLVISGSLEIKQLDEIKLPQIATFQFLTEISTGIVPKVWIDVEKRARVGDQQPIAVRVHASAFHSMKPLHCRIHVVGAPHGRDLILDVGERVAAEVLQPRDDAGGPALELLAGSRAGRSSPCDRARRSGRRCRTRPRRSGRGRPSGRSRRGAWRAGAGAARCRGHASPRARRRPPRRGRRAASGAVGRVLDEPAITCHFGARAAPR